MQCHVITSSQRKWFKIFLVLKNKLFQTDENYFYNNIKALLVCNAHVYPILCTYCLYTPHSIFMHMFVHRRAKHLVSCGNFVIFDMSEATKQKYTICALHVCNMPYGTRRRSSLAFTFCTVTYKHRQHTQHQHNQTMGFTVKMYYVLYCTL